MDQKKTKDALHKTAGGVKGVLGEFKEFISKGNVLDMAVGLIIGSAFTAIVTSLVDDILMPFIGMILAGVNFNSLGVTIFVEDRNCCSCESLLGRRFHLASEMKKENLVQKNKVFIWLKTLILIQCTPFGFRGCIALWGCIS